MGSIIRTILHQKNNLRTINPYDNRCGGYVVSIGPKNRGTLQLYRTVKDIAKSRIVIASFCCSEKQILVRFVVPLRGHCCGVGNGRSVRREKRKCMSCVGRLAVGQKADLVQPTLLATVESAGI